MQHSTEIDQLAAALSQAQGEFQGAPFNAENPFLKNKYADIGSFIETAKPVISKHGLSVSQLVYGDDNRIGVTTILMHSSGQWLSSESSLGLGDEKGKSLAQVAGSIITYLRRYSYAAILGMYSDDDDDDGNGNHHSAPAKPVQSSAPKPAYNRDERLLALKDLRGQLVALGNTPPALTTQRVAAFSDAEIEAEIAVTLAEVKRLKKTAATPQS